MKLPTLQSDLQATSTLNDHFARFADNAAHGIYQVTRSILQRDSSSTDTSSTDTPDCNSSSVGSRCQTPASLQSSQNLAIGLGVVIPLTSAIVVLIFLHRRHLKKQRLEDINDPHKSLDFGMDGVEPVSSKGSKGKKGPEMQATEIGSASSRRYHGMSMDLGMHVDSPYILPAGLNGSRESIHSMSRSMRDEHDPYRPVALMRPSNDMESSRFGRSNDDKGSIYSASTGQQSAVQDRAGLIANARPMSQSFTKQAEAMSPSESIPSGDYSHSYHSPMASRGTPSSRKPSMDRNIPGIVEEKNLPPPPPPVRKPLPQGIMVPRLESTAEAVDVSPHPPRKESMSTVRSAARRPESSNYGDEELFPPNVTINEPESYDIDPSAIYTGYPAENASTEPMPALQPYPPPASQRLSVMGVRPLPPDIPEDNPEVRANRIRSFYKEYFDDSKPNPANAQYDDHLVSAYMEGVVYDPTTGSFFAPDKPFAQGPARRAMTPPPRSRPRVSGNSNMNGPHQRKYSAYSTMSAGRPRGRSLPKKKLPPPKALSDLPTPHLMKDDASIFNAADFAPPTTFRNLQNGSRPGSPMGMQRPYSPTVRAFTPLASSFDTLAVLPSPHDLRRSGTFTALDFAPPSKIRDPHLSPSDAGSIRSNRSGMSAMQKQAVREGAYRVSRIPQELVSSKDDLASQLRPKMNMTSSA